MACDEKRAEWLRGVIATSQYRLETGGMGQVNVGGLRRGWRDLDEGDDSYHDTNEYRPTPAPKVRSFTPVEAVAHLGRIAKGDGPPEVLRDVSLHGVVLATSVNERRISYEGLAESFAFEDGSPCGVVEAGE